MYIFRSVLIIGFAFLGNGGQASAVDFVAGLGNNGFNFTYPGESTYLSAIGSYNLRYAYEPSVVTYPVNADQVSTIVRFAHAEGYNVVARSGGHSYIAAGLGGKNGSIVIDMRNWKELAYDENAQTATIGVGNRLGDIITFLGSKGRALPHGTCADVGWGGHVSYGGFGFTARMWGFALDTVISMNLVLANGTLATASETENPDLFWALRGAAGSFAIVTSTQVRTFEAPVTATTYTYGWQLNIEAAAKALQWYHDFAASNPSEKLGIELLLGKGESRGHVSFSFTGVWYGPHDDLATTLQPLLTLMGPEDWKDLIPGSYLDSAIKLAGGSLEVGEGGAGDSAFYAKSLVTPQDAPMTQAAQAAFITYIANEGYDVNVDWFLQGMLVGGQNSAVQGLAPEATSYPHRNSLLIMQFYAYSEGSLPAEGLTFVDGTVKSLVDNSPADWGYGTYANYADDRLENAASLYYKQNLQRLQQLKAVFDPTGVFNSPTGIASTVTEQCA